MAYEVSTPVFEGPFDLLLHLILREQVDIYEVSLAPIVDAYLAHLEQMQSLDLELTTEFLLIAATLVDLKARRLLPDLMEGVTAERLRAAFVRITNPKPVPVIDLFHVAPVRASVADAVTELVDELPRVGRIGFRRLTSGLVERLEVIVRFLALLELFKQGYVELEQGNRFGDIDIEWLGAPHDDDSEPADARAMVAALSIDDYEG